MISFERSCEATARPTPLIRANAMIQKLHKHNDGLALVIDRATLAAHGIDEETPVEVAFSGTTMIVTAGIDHDRKAKFERALNETHERFGMTLQKLGE
jgi:hypothetical protein